MIYSRSAEYAIRAFVHLAQVPEGKYAMVKNIAEQEQIPAHFLAKILQQLARKGLLRSSKGPTGGFAMRVDPGEVRLLDIVEALDGLAPFQQCASGLAECNDDMPCSMHDSWVALRSRIMDYLGRNTIANLVKALELRRSLWQLPPSARPGAWLPQSGPESPPTLGNSEGRWDNPSLSPWWSSRPPGGNARTTSIPGC